MPQLNLSSLNARELRRQLDASRARGDAAVTYRILQEMAARREGRAKRGRAGPRLVTIGGDAAPQDDEDVPPMPGWRPPTAGDPASPEVDDAGAAEAEAPAPIEGLATGAPAPASQPLEAQPFEAQPFEAQPPEAQPPEAGPAADAADDAPPPAARPRAPDPLEDDLRLAPGELRAAAPRAGRPARSGRGGALFTGLALGLVVGVGLGWWAADASRPAAAPQPVQAWDVPPPPAFPEPAAEAANSGPAPRALADAAPALPAPIQAEAAATTPSPPEPAVEGPPEYDNAAPTARADAGACAAESAPADRVICADPDLRRLQADLRRAYAHALEVHRDRELLRERQVAWAVARNRVTDPASLARLYAERTERLNAAAAAAQAAH